MLYMIIGLELVCVICSVYCVSRCFQIENNLSKMLLSCSDDFYDESERIKVTDLDL